MPSSIRFGISLFFTLFAPSYFSIPLFYFAPFIAFKLNKTSLCNILWISYGCGLITDLVSSSTFFGMTAINYSLVSLILYTQRRNFFEDSFSTLSIMTVCFSVLSTMIALVISFFLGHKLSLSGEFMLSELIVLPFCDGLYALLFFSLPFLLTRKLRRLISNRFNHNY